MAQQNDEPPLMVKESSARRRIEQEKQEYEKLIKRGEEALKLSEEIEKSFQRNNSFSADDLKKLEKLEKLLKRIRSDLGGEDDDYEMSFSDKESPASVFAFEVIKENVVSLVAELKKSTRFTISAIAIKSTNMVLKAVKFLRFGK